MTIQFGDVVHYELDGHSGLLQCIGRMSYNPRVVLLATEQAHGMPINEAHCRALSRGDQEIAHGLRSRYTSLYGEHFLEPLPE
jgi:hypothetical protein